MSQSAYIHFYVQRSDVSARQLVCSLFISQDGHYSQLGKTLASWLKTVPETFHTAEAAVVPFILKLDVLGMQPQLDIWNERMVDYDYEVSFFQYNVDNGTSYIEEIMMRALCVHDDENPILRGPPQYMETMMKDELDPQYQGSEYADDETDVSDDDDDHDHGEEQADHQEDENTSCEEDE